MSPAPPGADALAISPLGAAALLCDAAPPLSLDCQQRIWALDEAVQAWDGVAETVPGMNNLMLVFDPERVEPAALAERIQAFWQAGHVRQAEGKIVEIPVVYGGEHGEDLAAVAGRAGLSVAEAVRIHTGAAYRVFFVGAHPGFGYLGGLDPRLHTPRRAEPRLSVPAGSVAIGGAQAGVVAQTSPSGWNQIGRTELSFFDPGATPPTLLSPGDRVVFRATRVAA
ncbi:5-oxoprolinase subunit PxpB [Pseudorhodoferax sp. LjRoot39]|uniref:5-oxoprolinase subunit PxpB n=1 Tax=Pseudorhodoferax sp. LjRoot39 TaxID=3342328 RepID=UPI003ECD6217